MPTFTVDGAGDEMVVGTQFDKAWLHASGTFGGGSIVWEFKGDDGLWHPIVAGAAVSANSDLEHPVAATLVVRPTLSGATAPNIYYHAR